MFNDDDDELDSGWEDPYATWEEDDDLDFSYDFLEFIEHKSDVIDLLCKFHQDIKAEIKPAIRKLMYSQYPVLRTEERPLLVEDIEFIINYTANQDYLLKIYKLLEWHKKGEDLRTLYPKLDKWAKFYCRPAEPDTVSFTRPENYFWMTDEEWIEDAKKENEGLLQFYNWEQTRQAEYILLIQKIYFRYFPQLLDLNSDEWILFAVDIRDEYEMFKESCEHIEEFIDCGFPEEDFKLTGNDYFEKYSALPEEVRLKARDLRERRIAGERI